MVEKDQGFILVYYVGRVQIAETIEGPWSTVTNESPLITLPSGKKFWRLAQ